MDADKRKSYSNSAVSVKPQRAVKTLSDIYSTSFPYLENIKFPHRRYIYRLKMTELFFCP